MLVLSRKPGEKIYIGNNIAVTVVEVHGNRVKLGIEAPENKRILRGELAFWMDMPALAEPARKIPCKKDAVEADEPVIRDGAAAAVLV